MLQEICKLKTSQDSHPFQTASDLCHLKECGYLEEEYLMTGTANVYSEMDENHHVKIQYPDVPYTTRFLVRRPENPERFSGNVVVEILNATAMVDIDRIWINT